ncbi:hypothetical protein [Aromatoleum toluclasticum]|uniref:hypothetical protein n=1 Tax=Aromatoleum toluclasticum TaxID=92003 RepID=UPI0003A15B8B|nr:hypothetical protein [Aromatoleum toluclasticum]
MKTFTRWLRSCARYIGAATLVVGGLLLGAPPASAQSCIQDVWQAHGNTQSLTCTANDVTLSSATNLCIVVSPPGGPRDLNNDGCQDPNLQGQLTCVSGQPFTFTADFTMPLTAQARYDLGLYIATDGGGNDGALTGLCAPNVVTAANSSTFINKDSPPDICGDIDDAHNPQVIHQTITTTCSDTNGDNKVNLPWCTTWRQPGANEACDSGTFTTAGTFDAYPGSPSKCNCGTLDIDVFLETASITVVKEAVTPTVLETGGSVTYSVAVTNNAQVSDVDLDSLVDNLYGDITTTGHNGITATTCTLATIPAESNDPGGLNPYTCQFTVTVGAGDTGDTITDTVTACGTDDFGHSNLCDDDPAVVTYIDVSTPPSLAKTATATQAVAVDVQYSVSVSNNSTVDTLTLNSLIDDKFGDITAVAGNVQSTTCAVPQNIAAGGNYTCSFVGRITTTGLHTNVLDGAASDDDGVNYGAPPLQDSAQVNISVTFP